MPIFARHDKRALEALEKELEDALNEEVPEPDGPEETLSLASYNPHPVAAAWKIKIPEALMERWAAVQESDVHLATLRVYEPDPKDPKSKPRYFLFLPPNRDPENAPPVKGPTTPSKKLKSRGSASTSARFQNAKPKKYTPPSSSFLHPEVKDWPSFAPKVYDTFDKPYKTLPTTGRDEPDIYEVEMCDQELESSYIVAYAPDPTKAQNPLARQRTHLMAKVKKQGFLKRVMSASYRRTLRERHQKANAPKCRVKRIDMGEVRGSQGKGRRLIKAGPPFVARKEQKFMERMVRLPRNEALDVLFDLFKERTRWRVGELREASHQPEAYLKELLPEIAFQHQRGAFWELKPEFAVKAEQGLLIKEWDSPLSDGDGQVKEEHVEEGERNAHDDDEGDDEDDWEEVPTA